MVDWLHPKDVITYAYYRNVGLLEYEDAILQP